MRGFICRTKHYVFCSSRYMLYTFCSSRYRYLVLRKESRLLLFRDTVWKETSGEKHCPCQSEGGTEWQQQCRIYLLTKWDCLCNQAARKHSPSISSCGQWAVSKQKQVTRCTLPRRPARVRMSFSISVYISSSEKRPMPWPYISRFTIPLVRWQKIHFSKSLKGPKSETIFRVSWRFSTHWQ